MCICVCTLTRDSFAVELTDQLHRLSVIRTPYACAHLFRMLSMSVSLPVFPKKNPKKQTINCIAMNGIHLLTKMSQTMEEISRRKCAIAYSQTKELNSDSEQLVLHITRVLHNIRVHHPFQTKTKQKKDTNCN